MKKILRNIDIWKNQQDIFDQDNNFTRNIISHLTIIHVKKAEIVFK